MTSLGRSLLVAATGPVVAAVLALFVVNVLTRKAQDRRDWRLHRERLANEATETATQLYLACQRFWREAGRPMTPQARIEALETTATEKLDDAYESARSRARVLEGELRRRYGDSVAKAWHRVDDLLTVRYFQLTLRAPAALNRIYEKNAGEDHTGMSVEELSRADLVLERFRTALSDAVVSIEAAEP
jgi:hypothetical protein